MTLVEKVTTLLRHLSRGTSESVSQERLLGSILLDRAAYRLPADTLRQVEVLGVEVIDVALMSSESEPHLDPRMLTEALVSLA